MLFSRSDTYAMRCWDATWFVETDLGVRSVYINCPTDDWNFDDCVNGGYRYALRILDATWILEDAHG